ncbi:hypothetical protein FNV43_RR26755 [Rhamnella rubrinervis]|uniref:Uncharacterized protein n=1 Tax=Rhamnella rubrinervis TaxID=2594499 RepID=A0A8K0DNL2_9ROSA|nr:hypothetical protein FNV43_RR26755 [Rhamnella rubrinervis]
MVSLVKSLSCRLPHFSGKTPQQGPEIDLEAGRGFEFMTPAAGDNESEGRQSTHSIHGEDLNNPSPTIRLPMSVSPDQDRLHAVMKTLRKQELAKHMFALSIPLTTALLANQNPLSMSPPFRLFLILITIGFTALWIGNLLHEECHYAKNIELLGHVFVLIAIFGTMASFIGFSLLAVIPLVCLIVTVVPLGRAFISEFSSVSGN